jgi:hypothetical protein
VVFRRIVNYRTRRYEASWHNEVWVGKQLGLHKHGHHNIDLLDNAVGVEVKTKNRSNSRNWACANEEIVRFPDRHAGKELFWAFLLYDLNWDYVKPFNDINTLIRNREVWIMPMNWLDNFPVTQHTKRPYRYVHHYDFPESHYFNAFEKRGGVLYLPKDCALEERLREPAKTRHYVLKRLVA